MENVNKSGSQILERKIPDSRETVSSQSEVRHLPLLLVAVHKTHNSLDMAMTFTPMGGKSLQEQKKKIVNFAENSKKVDCDG